MLTHTDIDAGLHLFPETRKAFLADLAPADVFETLNIETLNERSAIECEWLGRRCAQNVDIISAEMRSIENASDEARRILRNIFGEDADPTWRPRAEWAEFTPAEIDDEIPF